MSSQGNRPAGNEKLFRLKFREVYPLYIKKAERKGRTKEEVDAIITWLTGYSALELRSLSEGDVDFEAFFAGAPAINPNAGKITGRICGYRVEDIEDPLARRVRYLDKLVDELAGGKALERILRA